MSPHIVKMSPPSTLNDEQNFTTISNLNSYFIRKFKDEINNIGAPLPEQNILMLITV